MPDFPPALIFFLGCLPIPFLHGWLKNAWTILVPAVAFVYIWQLDPQSASYPVFLFQGFPEMEMLRVDKLSLAFGTIFTLNATACMIYAFYLKENTQHMSALAYVGSALGVVFAGDLISLYIFWELMAITSTFLILARRTEDAYAAGFRYILVHVFGGLLLLAGIVITIMITPYAEPTTAFTAFEKQHLGTVLIILGMLVNAAAFPLSAWLPDAYASSSITAGVFLSAYTTKTAVYALIRGFPGWEMLIWVGAAMAIYGVIYALLENDIRRILAYAIINQVGFMVMAVGIGSEMALNGATLHAFSHILYKSLLWMVAGAVIYRVGKNKFTELGGLAASMPRTMFFACLGVFSIASFPLTSAFNTKAYIIDSAAHAHLHLPWLILEFAASGIFVAAGLKFLYFVFFCKRQRSVASHAPHSMIAAMSLLAAVNISLGINPAILESLMPWPMEEPIHTLSAGHIIPHLQLLAFSAVAFFLMLPWIRSRHRMTLDTDWFYRKGSKWLYRTLDVSLNSLNAGTYQRVVKEGVGALNRGINKLQGSFAAMCVRLSSLRPDSEDVRYRADAARIDARAGSLPVGLGVLLPLLLVCVLLIAYGV